MSRTMRNRRDHDAWSACSRSPATLAARVRQHEVLQDPRLAAGEAVHRRPRPQADARLLDRAGRSHRRRRRCRRAVASAFRPSSSASRSTRRTPTTRTRPTTRRSGPSPARSPASGSATSSSARRSRDKDLAIIDSFGTRDDHAARSHRVLLHVGHAPAPAEHRLQPRRQRPVRRHLPDPASAASRSRRRTAAACPTSTGLRVVHDVLRRASAAACGRPA